MPKQTTNIATVDHKAHSTFCHTHTVKSRMYSYVCVVILKLAECLEMCYCCFCPVVELERKKKRPS